jgi:bifunctional non-homologous end joining protein LigD
MRRFDRTPEPAGEARPTAKKKQARKAAHRSFVVQKHEASHLHYDFRLEHEGVLLSWAVPKGPSLDPEVKRLALEVEDHPVDYGAFEGIIPKGEYGGGTVMLWDRGTWEPEGDVDFGRKKGHLMFTLHGERLQGAFHLLRTGGPDEKKPRWLLVKRDDEFARGGQREITERFVKSVTTERTMQAIAKSPRSKVHRSTTKTPSQEATTSTKAKTTAKKATKKATTKRAPRVTLPSFVEPALCRLVERAPEGDEWLHEVKLDGYRLQVRLEDGEARVRTRRGNDWTGRMPLIANALGRLKTNGTLLDGELVVLGEKSGKPDFQALQNALREGAKDELVYFAFDLLFEGFVDLRALPLEERKARLAKLLRKNRDPRVRFSGHIEGSGEEVHENACAAHLEGVVSKRRDAPYVSGRHDAWQKSKCGQRQEMIIGGFTKPRGSRSELGALVLGVRDDEGKKLRYAGKVGTGFSAATLRELAEKLQARTRKTPPFTSGLDAESRRGVTWVTPDLVAEIGFQDFTREGRIRHGRYLGLRLDKTADEVVAEVPVTPEKVATQPASTRATPARATKKPPAEHEADAPRLTHPDKVLYQLDKESVLTKRDLADYYAAVADALLTYSEGRPLTLVRCPAGAAGKCFFQKHAGKGGVPEGLVALPIADETSNEGYLALESARGLASLVQLGALELHTWGAHGDDPEHPDLLVLDLDPDPSLDFAEVIEAAHDVRAMLAEIDLQSWVKTTGGKGLHVCVPVRRTLSWDAGKALTKGLAHALESRHPERYVANMAKKARRGKIFVDYLRNGRGQTFVAPYSTRAREGAPVAWPVAWEELKKGFDPRAFDVTTVPALLAKRPRDPWADLLTTKQTVSKKVLRALGQ